MKLRTDNNNYFSNELVSDNSFFRISNIAREIFLYEHA